MFFISLRPLFTKNSWTIHWRINTGVIKWTSIGHEFREIRGAIQQYVALMTGQEFTDFPISVAKKLILTWIYITPCILNNFFTTDRLGTTKYFWKNSIEVGRSHFYASFGTFCIQIDQLFEAQWDFELLEEFEIDVIQKQQFHVFKHFSKTHCVAKKWPICTQKVSKEM